MPRACRHLLLALAALIALGGAAPSLAADAAAPHDVAVVAGDTHHGEPAAHCAAGAGASCQVPAITGASVALILRSRPARPAPPAAAPGAALTRLGPRPPVPIG